MRNARRKTLRKPPNLSANEILVRRSGGSVETIGQIRRDASLQSLKNILAWAYPRYKLRRHLASLKPRKSTQLPEYIIASGDEFFDAVKWMVALISVNKDSIHHHNKNTYTSISRISDYLSSFNAALEELQGSMWSYAAASQALFALARVSGLDAQRRWMDANAYVPNPSLSNIIFYSKAIACEGDRHPSDIMEILSRFIYSRLSDEEVNLFLYYLTFNPAIDQPLAEKLASLFLYNPVVDQYEFLVNFITSDPQAASEERLAYREELFQVLSDCQDWRAEPLAKLAGTYEPNTIAVPLISAPVVSLLKSLDIFDARTSPADREFEIALANEFLHQPQAPRSYLASSLFALKSAQSLSEVMSAVFRRELARDFFEQTSEAGPRSPRRQIRLSFASVSAEMRGASSTYEKRELFRIACLCGLVESKVLETLILLYEFTNEDKLGVAYFPHELVHDTISEDDVALIGSDARVAVALSRISTSLGDEGPNLVYIAVEQYLMSLKHFKPSEISGVTKVEIDFLREACTSSSLRQSLEFLSKAEMEEERIAILFNLAQFDPDNDDQYVDEIHDIIGQQTIDELLQRFHVGKVQCDEHALASWATSELLPKFNRLRDFIDAGMLPVERNADVEFVAHLTSGKLETFTFKVPSNESLDIARTILSEMNQKFALDPRYGVDSYLSLGMRHGAVAAHLRSPLSTENILTTKGLLGYPDDCFWKDYYLENGGQLYAEMLGLILARFSERFDDRLEEIKDELLQVRRPDKPKGLIIADWSEASVLSFSARFAAVADFPSFISEFTSFFWANMEGNLATARDYIETVLANELSELLDGLEQDIRSATGQQRLAPFSDALMRARQELGNAVRDVSSWHNVARSSDVEPLGLVDIILAAQKIVNRLYPEFVPQVQFSGDTSISLTYSLHILIEVFKALFTNVYEHSHMDRPVIDVAITVISETALGVDFISDCADVSQAEQAAIDNNEKIRTGEYEKKLPKEGGSGLAKVARSTLRDGKPNTVVSVDRENSKFSVSMIFSLVNL